ncbi:lipid IV(A) 3-deoxy-D-manno-octulosonic acid transferase [Sodalis-like secondary symbiont of Drepanosiphum platanoidis]|uniref:lipid IV(A) 3-deoxy-D-manno-octulosonic acid transferase n=1 Tax=Sodalis-like secondary symbiont of Drepanosiphum platanoidis TaxID=2994493 RepID=UPI003464AB59
MKFLKKKIKIYLYIYNIIMFLIQPYIWIRFFFKKKNIFLKDKRFFERYGFFNKKIKSNGILIHAVSVGEILSSIPLIKLLKKKYPKIPIIFTTTTISGSKLINLKYNKNIFHLYFPYDLFFSVNRFLNKISPRIIILMERELWPNFIYLAFSKKIPLIIANARLSNKSVIFYKKINFFMLSILKKITLIAAQSNKDKMSFLDIGIKNNKIKVTGNIKFNISINSKLKLNAIKLKKKWAHNRYIWIAGSTHKGEEKIIIKAHKKLLKIFPNLLLIIVPRHINRCFSIEKIIINHNLKYIYKSSGKNPSINTNIIIVDTIGELLLLYRISDIAFIGGSLINKYYGHNPLEAAINSIPILIGPYTKNFLDICYKLKKLNGLIIVKNIIDLVKNISNLLKNNNYRLTQGKNGYKIFYKNSLPLLNLLKLLNKYIK